MDHELRFHNEATSHSVTVQVLLNSQVVATGHVFLGDMVAEQFCTYSVQRPHLLTKTILADLKSAMAAITGEEQRAADQRDSVKVRAA